MAQPKPDSDREWQEPELPEGPLYRPEGYDGPLVCPFYGSDHPARRNSESKRAFNEKVARLAFGDRLIDFRKRQVGGPGFTGDWWMLETFWHAQKLPGIKPDIGLEGWPRIAQGLFAARILVHLEGAFLSNLRIDRLDLQCVHAERVVLDCSNLQEAQLSFCSLRAASLRQVNFDDSSCTNTDFSGALASGTTFRRVRFHSARFTGASIAACDFTDAVFDRSDLRLADIENSWLRRADVRTSQGLLVNSNEAVQLRIEGTASDPWSTLRREYTGPRYLVHLLLTIAFLLPFAFSVFHLSAVDEAYRTISTLAAERAGEPIDSAIPRAALRESVEAFDRHHVRVPSAAVLLGWPQGWWFLAMTAVVVAYNAMRVVLTIGIPWYWPGGVTALRDAEERSHITPSLEEYYGPLHPITDGYKRHVLGWREVDGRLTPPEHEWGEFHRSAREAWWLLRVWALPSLNRRSERHNRYKDIGLYRLHQAAFSLLILAVVAFLVRALLWIIHSRVPIPVESLL